MSCFIYTDLFSSLLDLTLVDPGSTLIHVGAYGPKTTKMHKVRIFKSLNYFLLQ